VEGKPTRKGMNMSEAKHTKGNLNVCKRASTAIEDETGLVIATTGGWSDSKRDDVLECQQANAARLCAGWNLLNRLEEMGVAPDDVPKLIIVLREALDDKSWGSLTTRFEKSTYEELVKLTKKA
jgi:hypothetical protein